MKKILLVALLLFSACQTKNGKHAPPPLEPGQPYDRKQFDHWIDEDKDCQNTRQEILIARSLTPAKLGGKRKCTVRSGEWKDFYYNETLQKAGEVDIDHVVPLKHAWETGADSWDSEKRRAFANDPENLVITNRKYNRQKGAKTILEWMPIDRSYACRYANQWFLIKEKYKLSISDKEIEYRNTMKCAEVPPVR